MAELRAQHVEVDAAGRGSVLGESMGSGHRGCRNQPPPQQRTTQPRCQQCGARTLLRAPSGAGASGQSHESARSLSLSPRTGGPSRRTE